MHVSNQQVKHFLFRVVNKATITGEMSEFVTQVRKEIFNATTEEDAMHSANSDHGNPDGPTPNHGNKKD